MVCFKKKHVVKVSISTNSKLAPLYDYFSILNASPLELSLVFKLEYDCLYFNVLTHQISSLSVYLLDFDLRLNLALILLYNNVAMAY